MYSSSKIHSVTLRILRWARHIARMKETSNAIINQVHRPLEQCLS